MRKARKFVGLLMTLGVLGVPVLACALPGVAMNEDEQACCRHMAEQCGSTQMPASHSCCTKIPHAGASQLQATSKFSPAVLDCVSHVAACQPALLPSCAGLALHNFSENSESPPGYSSVLRI